MAQQQQGQESKSGEQNDICPYKQDDVIQIRDNPPLRLLYLTKLANREHECDILALDITAYYGTSMTNDELKQKLPECDQWIMIFKDNNRKGEAFKLKKKIIQLRSVPTVELHWKLCDNS